MEKDQLLPGTVLADKYRLESVLGVGGMGTVYRAEHLALKAPVAIKVIDRHVEEGDLTLARFMREAQSAAALRSPHVVQILDYGSDQGRPFMVMELLEGEPLADRIKRESRLSPEETYQILLHVSKAVAKAHEAEIVHRDLKPDNIFLVHNEGDELAKVLDFGVAKVEATALDGEGHTRTGSLLGTPYYMSPEQAQGNKDVDARSDLWALGVIAFECLTGVRPFQSEGLGDLVLQICIRDIPIPSNYAKVPEGFDAWFKKACEREPIDRFQTARELAEALRIGLNVDSTNVPESRWATAAERAPRSLGGRGGVAGSRGVAEDRKLSEDTTHNESDTSTWIETQSSALTTAESDPPSSLRAARLQSSSQLETAAQPETAAHPETAAPFGTAPRAEPSRPAAKAPDNWQVVPHGAEEELPMSGRRAHSHSDLPDESKEPAGATRIAAVALLAIVFGGAIVFGLRELDLVPFGASHNTNKPLKVIGSSKKHSAGQDAPGADTSAEESGTSSSNKGKTGQAEETAEQRKLRLDAKKPVAKPLTKEEREAAQILNGIDPENPTGSSTEEPETPAPKAPPSGPQPVLPEELTPTPTPAPPANSSGE